MADKTDSTRNEADHEINQNIRTVTGGGVNCIHSELYNSRLPSSHILIAQFKKKRKQPPDNC